MASGSCKDKNTVFYRIYPVEKQVDLEKLRLKCLQSLGSLIAVVWNAEGFTLRLEKHPTLPHLAGQLWYDNSVEDEWYVVWLLRKLTAELAVAAKVWDDDGEFILIEAAEALPAWLNPDNSENRLFLYKGEVLLIPQPATPAEFCWFPPNDVTIEQALCCIDKIDSSRCAKLNEIVNCRLSNFPARSLHRIRCHLPIALVHALTVNPELISTIISIYLYSDKREIQSIIKNRKLSWTETCDTNCDLTRCQYAQLYSQRITTTSSWSHLPVGHVDHEARQLGLKLTLGAELALSLAMGDTTTDKEFSKYLNRLESFGYFEGMIEGSKSHSELLKKAELFYRSSQEEDSGSAWLTNSRILNTLVADSCYSDVYPTYKDMEVTESESDAWMDVMPDEIQKWFLKGREFDEMQSGDHEVPAAPPHSPQVEEVATEHLSELNTKLQGFINQMSSHEGAEVPPDPEINLNVDDFMNCLRDLKDQIDSANRESESEDTSSLGSGSIRSESEEEMQEYMRDLEEQLQGTTLSESFKKDGEGDLDIDLNLVSNILQSFSAETGLSGPASSVLASLGVHLPRDDDS